jgi:hypothetical protein
VLEVPAAGVRLKVLGVAGESYDHHHRGEGGVRTQES